MAPDDFFDVGYDTAERVAQESRDRRQSSSLGRRFWLPNKAGDDPENPINEARVIFLGGAKNSDGEATSAPICWWEHELKIDSRWGNYFTCTLGHEGQCPFCEKGVSRYYCGGFTIIDTRRWKSKHDGEEHVNEKKFVVFKSDNLSVFHKKQQKRNKGVLMGTLWETMRTGDKKPREGDQWDFIEAVDLSKVLDVNGDPIDTEVLPYKDFLKPASEERASEVLASWTPPQRGGQGPNKSGYGGKSVKY